MLAVVGALGGAGVVAGAYAEFPEGAELLVAIVVAVTSPGLALIVWFFRDSRGWATTLLCIPISLSINIVVALLSLYAGFWPPGWYLVALALVAMIGALLETPIGDRVMVLVEADSGGE